MYRFKKIIFSFVLIFTLSFSSLTLAIADSDVAADDISLYNNDVNMAGEYVKSIIALINDYYIGSEVSLDELVKGAVSGMAEKLDEYSQFLDDKELGNVLKETSNTTEGLGISYYENFKDGYPLITSVYSESPAEKAGILKNDVLISIDGNDLKGKKGSDISAIILNKKGSSIDIIVERGGVKTELSAEVGDFVMPTVFVSDINSMLNGLDKKKADKVRYIQIASFGEKTGKEFKEIAKELENQGVDSIIIDFRFNGGGVTQAAYEMCEVLVKEGPFLNISTKTGKYTVDSEDDFVPFKNIAILTNEATASAAELVTAVLKDNGAVVVGEKTFGKGVTQAIIELTNLGALKMTTEEFSPMSGKKINGIGIVPDFEVQQIKVIKNDSQDFQKDVEIALKDLGFDIATNEKKQAVIKQLQKKYSVKETGEIDYETISIINSEIVNKNFKDDSVFEKAVEVIFSKM